MKNIFKTFISCIVLAVGVTSCYDEMDSKSNIDAEYEQASNITASLGESAVLTFSEISVNGNISGTEGVLEAGFMVSTSADFASYNSYKAGEVASTFSSVINNLTENTTYYIRSYAYTIGGTIVSEVTSITTPAAPIFELNGGYTAVDYNTEDNSAGESYEVTIEFVSGSTTDIKITNLWDGGKTINAKYDSKTGKVSIPTKQVIFVHADYGDVWMEDVNGSQNISGLFTPKGGFLNINAFSAICGSGTFGDRYVKMSHK